MSSIKYKILSVVDYLLWAGAIAVLVMNFFLINKIIACVGISLTLGAAAFAVFAEINKRY